MTKVTFETSKGNFTIKLSETKPITTGNFVKLVEKGFYDGIAFHRIIDNFMIQGGCPKGNGTGGPGYNIKDEWDAPQTNKKYTIAMANAGPNTGGSQFFINTVNNNYLDKNHPVFGEVVEGKDVIDSIGVAETNRADVPITPIVMTKVFVSEA